MTLKEDLWLKISGFFGIFSPILTLSVIAVAINSYQFFDWESNALSDLGIISGITSILFNNGLIIGGLVTLLFIPGLFILMKKTNYSKFCSSFFALTCCFLILIGIFPEDVVPIHYLVSVGFFVCLPISLFLVAISFYFTNKKVWAFFTLIFALFVAMPWIVYFLTEIFTAVAIPEIISGVGLSIWIIILGSKMFLSVKNPEK